MSPFIDSPKIKLPTAHHLQLKRKKYPLLESLMAADLLWLFYLHNYLVNSVNSREIWLNPKTLFLKIVYFCRFCVKTKHFFLSGGFISCNRYYLQTDKWIRLHIISYTVPLLVLIADVVLLTTVSDLVCKKHGSVLICVRQINRIVWI